MTGATAGTRRERAWRGGRDRNEALALLLPGLVIFAVFALLPFGRVVELSVMRWDGLSPTQTFVGLQNFRDVLGHDPVFWTALVNTGIWTALSLLVPPAIGFGLALGLNENLAGRGLLRTVFYLPVVIAPIAVATMWRWMYDPFFGIMSSMLKDLGVARPPDWLGDPHLALYSVFAAYVWQSVGFSLVLFLAGLQGVSGTLLEAARMDGATRWQSLRHVTVPSLSATFTVVLVLSAINALRTFDIIYGMTHGGPGQASQVLVLWAFWQSLQLHDYGRGGAIAVILLAISFVVVVPYVRWIMRREREAAA